MADLALTWDDLRSEVGFYLGHGRTSSAWSADETATINAVVDAGYRNFIYPRPLPGMVKAHEWSFLRPSATIDVVANEYKYNLPSDFGGFDGTMVVESTNSYPPLRKTDYPKILQWRGVNSTLTGVPCYFADAPKNQAGVSDQGWEVWLHPNPDQSYTLRYPYRVNPRKLSATQPYPYGGPEHAETIIQSCLAVAEKRLDGLTADHHAEFLAQLAHSISQDAARKPGLFGYNGNGRNSIRRRDQSVIQATYRGYLPEDFPG